VDTVGVRSTHTARAAFGGKPVYAEIHMGLGFCVLHNTRSGIGTALIRTGNVVTHELPYLALHSLMPNLAVTRAVMWRAWLAAALRVPVGR
jgi:hypothetical protein